jgi:hypothetical protein
MRGSIAAVHRARLATWAAVWLIAAIVGGNADGHREARDGRMVSHREGPGPVDATSVFVPKFNALLPKHDEATPLMRLPWTGRETPMSTSSRPGSSSRSTSS